MDQIFDVLSSRRGFLLATLFALWAVFFYTKFEKLYRVHLKDFLAPDVNKMARYPVASRYDAVNIEDRFWRYYFTGIFLMPLKMTLFFGLASIAQVWSFGMMKIFGVTFQNSQDFHNARFTFWLRLVIVPISWLLYLVSGFSPYKVTKHSIYDYLPDYAPVQDTRVAPIVLSNHSSFLEILAHWQENISFLAKVSNSDVPFLGTQVLTRQMVYIM